MHGHDGLRVITVEGGVDRFRIDVERFGIDVDEHRACAGAQDRAGAGEEAKRCSEYNVAGLNSERSQREPESVSPGGAADRAFCAQEGCCFLLEFLQLLAADEILGGTDALERLLHFVLDLRVLPLQVERRYGRASGGAR